LAEWVSTLVGGGQPLQLFDERRPPHVEQARCTRFVALGSRQRLANHPAFEIIDRVPEIQALRRQLEGGAR